MDGWILAGESKSNHNAKRLELCAKVRSIDKTSSSELSEAINSMFMWYQNSDICYAYLSDVPDLYSVHDPNWMGVFDVRGIFKWSAWFTRGWTLQELIAPSVVEFYTADWKPFGSKEILQKKIAEITGINPKALLGENLSTFNIAERMSWAASRTTTRLEDKAYSLLGVFQVNMPLLYGEGNRAFLRLQEEILKTTEDYTIFAWPGAVNPVGAFSARLPKPRELTYSLFASDTSEFRLLEHSSWQYSDLVRIPREELDAAAPKFGQDTPGLEGLNLDEGPPTITGRGLGICLPLMYLKGQEYLASTYCKLKKTNEWVCIPLTRNRNELHRFARNSWESSGIQLIQIQYPDTMFKRCLFYGERPDNPLSRTKPSSRVHNKPEQLLSDGHFAQAIKLAERLYHPKDPVTFELICNVMQKYVSQSRYEDAELLGLDLVKKSKAILGETHEYTLKGQHYLSVAMSKEGRWDAAEEILRHLVLSYDKILGETHFMTILSRARRAENMFNLDSQKGTEYLQKVMDRFETFLDYKSLEKLSANKSVPLLDSKIKRSEGDKEMLSVLADVSRTIKGEGDPGTLLIMLCQSFLIYRWREKSDYLSELGQKLRSNLGESHKLTLIGEAALKSI